MLKRVGQSWLKSILDGSKQNEFVYSQSQFFRSLPIEQQQEVAQKFSDPDYRVHVPGGNALTDEQATAALKSSAGSYFKSLHEDPTAAAEGSPQFSSQNLNIINSLQAQNNTLQPHAVQSQAQALANDPSLVFKGSLSPVEHSYVSQRMALSLQTQRSMGVQSSQLQGLTNSQAATLVRQLDVQDGGDRRNYIVQASRNYGGNWPYVQRSLIKAGLPTSDITAAALHENTNTFANSDDVLAAHDYMNNNPTAFKALNIKSNDANVDVMSNSDVQNYWSSMAAIPGPDAHKIAMDNIKTITNLSIYRMAKAGKNSWDQDIADKASHDVLFGLSQNGGATSLHVPFYITTTSSSGTTTRTPVNLETVQLGQGYFKQHIKDLADLNVPDIPGENSQQKSLRESQYAQSIQNGHWILTPNGDGAVLYDSNNRQVKLKNGKPYGFTFLGLQNSPPAGFNTYISATHSSSLWHKFFDIPKRYGAGIL